MMEKYKQLTILSVLLAIIIEVMSMGLFMPLMPNLFWSASSPILAPDISSFWRQMDYGLSFAFWAAGCFFGAPFFGDVSDRIGRKKVLLLSLFFVMLSYLLSYLSLVIGSITLFMLARVMSGFFASSFPIAQAVIVDSSEDKNRARNLGWVSLAASIGIVFGPFLSGICYRLGGAVYGAKLAFLLAAVLTILNFIMIRIFLQESVTKRSHRPLRLFSVFFSCRFAFTDKRIRALSLLFFILSALWALFFQAISIIFVALFNAGPSMISAFYTCMGVGIFVMTIFIQPKLLKVFRLKTLGISALLIMAILFGLCVILPYVKLMWVSSILAAMLEGLCYTVFITLFSKAVNADEQGLVMGSVGAVFGLTWGLVSPLTGILFGLKISLPLIFACALAVTGMAVMTQVVRKNA